MRPDLGVWLSFLGTGLDSVGLVVGLEEVLLFGLDWISKLGRDTGLGFS